MDTSFKQQYGSWALVTGAAMGLGAEFALQIAQKGISIIAVDNNKEALEATAQRIKTETQVDVRSIHLDLARADFLEVLLPQIEDCEVGLLVNNAGISKIGYFAPQSKAFLAQQLHINTKVVLLLTHHFTQQMQVRKRGGIIILSSGAGELSSAYNAVYSATKAFDLKLAESLWAELKPFGVDVLGFMPGPTKTPGYIAQGGDGNGSMVMSATTSVQQALKALGKSPNYVAGSFLMRFGHYFLTRFLSTKLRIKIVSSQIKTLFKVS
jgi:short-subunit dehydrogenase